MVSSWKQVTTSPPICTIPRCSDVQTRGRRHRNVSQKRVRVERDRRHERLQFSRADLAQGKSGIPSNLPVILFRQRLRKRVQRRLGADMRQHPGHGFPCPRIRMIPDRAMQERQVLLGSHLPQAIYILMKGISALETFDDLPELLRMRRSCRFAGIPARPCHIGRARRRPHQYQSRSEQDDTQTGTHHACAGKRTRRGDGLAIHGHGLTSPGCSRSRFVPEHVPHSNGGLRVRQRTRPPGGKIDHPWCLHSRIRTRTGLPRSARSPRPHKRMIRSRFPSARPDSHEEKNEAKQT